MNHRKKVRRVIMGVFACGILLSGCNQTGDSATNEPTLRMDSETEHAKEISDNTQGDATERNESSEQENRITEAEIKQLFEKNLYCMTDIFLLGDLEHSEEAVDGEMIYPVTDDKFDSLADLEEYLLTVYSAEEVDRLLYHYPYDDQTKYLERDGRLCIDMNVSGGRGYYVDWTESIVIMKTIEEDRCTFLVQGTIEEPADEPVQEEYMAEGAVVYERGRWVLEKMIY